MSAPRCLDMYWTVPFAAAVSMQLLGFHILGQDSNPETEISPSMASLVQVLTLSLLLVEFQPWGTWARKVDWVPALVYESLCLLVAVDFFRPILYKICYLISSCITGLLLVMVVQLKQYVDADDASFLHATMIWLGTEQASDAMFFLFSMIIFIFVIDITDLLDSATNVFRRSHVKCPKVTPDSEVRELDRLVASDPSTWKCSACVYELIPPGLPIEQTDSRRESLAMIAEAFEDVDEEGPISTGVACTPKSQSETNIYGLSCEARDAYSMVKDFTTMHCTVNELRETVMGMSEDVSTLIGIVHIFNDLNNSVERLHLENMAIKAQLAEVLKAQSSVDMHVCKLGARLSPASKSTTSPVTVTSSREPSCTQGVTMTTVRAPGGRPAPICQTISGLALGTYSSSNSVINESAVGETAPKCSDVAQKRNELRSGNFSAMQLNVTQRSENDGARVKERPSRAAPLLRDAAAADNPGSSPHPSEDDQKACGDGDRFIRVTRRRRRKRPPLASPTSDLGPSRDPRDRSSVRARNRPSLT